MCVTFLFIRPPNDKTSKYKLIILNNRDEVISRKTSNLAWEGDILCGRDEQAKDRGTWFGISKNGKIGILLSITQPISDRNPMAPSRGSIVMDYLSSGQSGVNFVKNLSKKCEFFNGFQFLAFDRTLKGEYGLTTLVQKFVDEIKPEQWSPERGVLGFGNSPPERPYLKVLHGTKIFEEKIEKIKKNPNLSENKVIQELMEVAKDKNHCEPDPQLELQAELDRESLHFLTSLFIVQQQDGDYGTRSHSILLVDSDDNVTFYESSLESGSNTDGKWKTTVEKFNLSKI